MARRLTWSRGSITCSANPTWHFEPDVGFAYTDDEGRLTIHSKASASTPPAMINEGLGLEHDNLRMVQNPIGGTFGYKFCPTMEALLGAAHWPPAAWATSNTTTG